jgi:hypothetical protein
MKKQTAAIGSEMATLRAGVISSLILALCYLYITGLSNLPRVWSFMILFAVCFVLMMKSVVDVFVWSFGVTSRSSGFVLGRATKTFRRGL